jgi:hypothetical protein
MAATGEEKWWVSHPQFTGQVNTDRARRIISTPPAWRKFQGQPLGQLLDWLRDLGPGLKYQKL